jgi:hypothetical protein
MTELSDNRDLYQYLIKLATRLTQAGSKKLADIAMFAASQASAMSTEFLGESRIALREIQSLEQGVLSDEERDELNAVLKQLDRALGK